jgi:hypothetical protein
LRPVLPDTHEAIKIPFLTHLIVRILSPPAARRPRQGKCYVQHCHDTGQPLSLG